MTISIADRTRFNVFKSIDISLSLHIFVKLHPDQGTTAQRPRSLRANTSRGDLGYG
jgi:hypothetical protein